MSGLSRPRFSSMSATVSGGASGGAISSAMFPDARLSRNTTVTTTHSTRIDWASRTRVYRSKSWLLRSQPGDHCVRVALHGRPAGHVLARDRQRRDDDEPVAPQL